MKAIALIKAPADHPTTFVSSLSCLLKASYCNLHSAKCTSNRAFTVSSFISPFLLLRRLGIVSRILCMKEIQGEDFDDFIKLPNRRIWIGSWRQRRESARGCDNMRRISEFPIENLIDEI